MTEEQPRMPAGARRVAGQGPLLVLGLGAVLLAHTTGLLPAGWWWLLARLWPVLLVLVGLDMLIGRRTASRVALVLGLSGLVVVGAVVWVLRETMPGGG